MFITVIESNLGQFVNDTNPFISENVALHLKKKKKTAWMGRNLESLSPSWGIASEWLMEGATGFFSGMWLLVAYSVWPYSDTHMNSTNWNQWIFKNANMEVGGRRGENVWEELWIWSKYNIYLSEILKEYIFKNSMATLEIFILHSSLNT